MSDFATRSKVRVVGFAAPPLAPPGRPITNRREIFRDRKSLHAIGQSNTRTVPSHDCYNDVIKMAIDDGAKAWTTRCLAECLVEMHGQQLQQTRSQAPADQSTQQSSNETGNKSEPTSTLLVTVGRRGHGDQELEMPRAVAIDADTGEMYVADAGNDRIQRFTQCGIFVESFGERGSGPGQFRNPSGIAVPVSGSTVLVADRDNGRIQIFTKAKNIDARQTDAIITTSGRPYSVTVDAEQFIVVGTTRRTVEIYDTFHRLAYHFHVGTDHPAVGSTPAAAAAAPIDVVSTSEPRVVAVLDRALATVSHHAYDGRVLRRFEPSHAGLALAFQPTGLAVDGDGLVIIADGLNHAVAVFERGRLVRYVVEPGCKDSGPVQAVALGPEGHLVCVEFAVNGKHCVKVWRYRECPCHAGATDN